MLEAIISFIDRVVQMVTPTLNSIVAGLLIIFIGFIVGKFLRGFLLKILRDARVDETGKKVLKRNVSFASNVSSVVAYGIYVLSFIMALEAIGITSVVFSAIGIIFLVVIVISLAISFKDSIPNLIVGVRMRKQAKYDTGRTISFLGVHGIIKERTLIQIKVERKNGDQFIFSNKLFKEKV